MLALWLGLAWFWPNGRIVLFCQELSKEAMKTELIQLFREKVRAGELPSLLETHCTYNIPFLTLGGSVFWTTYEEGGWKLQFNDVSGWWRILDASEVRFARGTTLKQLRNLLEGRPTSVVSNYFDVGYRFGKTSAKTPTGRSVVLIHGWGVRASSMQKLADVLAEEGFDAYNYDYPSAKATLAGQVAVFLEKFRGLLAQLPASEKIYLLTHSMGGLILRGALAQMTLQETQRIQAIVMLGPPNRGSGLAYFGKLPGVSAVNASLEDMTPDADSYVMTIPPPVWLPPIGIIAGSKDGKVSEKSTHLPEPLKYEHIVVKSTHPGLRKPEKVLTYILKFFKEKKF